MFTIFRAFYASGPISGGIYVAVSSGLAQDGVSPLIYPCPVGTQPVGTIEPLLGNNGNPFDQSVNTALPVTVRLFGPSRNVSVTGVPTTGLPCGTLLYGTTGGQASITGTIVVGVSVEIATTNGVQIEVCEVV